MSLSIVLEISTIAKAEYKNGLLDLHLPKGPESSSETNASPGELSLSGERKQMAQFRYAR